MMMKQGLLFAALAAISFSVLSDDHAAPETAYGMAYQITATNPAAVVGSMKEFMASPSGQNNPVSVTLMQNMSNGDNMATHQINVVYPSLAVMEQSSAANAQSVDWMRYMTTLSRSADVVSENMFSMEMAKINADLSGQTGAVSMLTLMSVSDPETFMKAFQKLMASSAASDFPGDIYFGRIIGAGENPATHWVTARARNMSDLMSGNEALTQSKDMAAYLRAVRDARAVQSVSIQRTALSFPAVGMN